MLARTIPADNACTLACPTPRGTANRSRTTLRTRAAAALRRGWRTYWERRARRATLLILHALDERTLRDIGISPSEIHSCVYSNSRDRRRRYHARWPWRSGG
jgi:uncharacterized protein YjiS (DUF1127 family)